MKKLKQIGEVEVQNYGHLKKHSRKRYTYILGVCGVVILLVGTSLIQISVSNSLTTDGLTLGRLQNQIDQIKKENTLLSEQLYSEASYTHIASEAATLGFVEAKSAIYLSDPMPIALR